MSNYLRFGFGLVLVLAVAMPPTASVAGSSGPLREPQTIEKWLSHKFNGPTQLLIEGTIGTLDSTTHTLRLNSKLGVFDITLTPAIEFRREERDLSASKLNVGDKVLVF